MKLENEKLIKGQRCVFNVTLQERSNIEETDIKERIILKQILKKWGSYTAQFVEYAPKRFESIFGFSERWGISR